MTNQANINAAIETARAKVAGNAARTRGVEKAAALVAGGIIVTVLMDGGIVLQAFPDTARSFFFTQRPAGRRIAAL